MKTPAGLLGAAIVFWGWQTGLLVLAVVVAVLIEGSRVVPWRWDLTPLDEGRVSDLSTLVFVALAVYLAFVAGAPMRIFEWMPLALLPLLVAQAYSRAGTIAISAMLWARREQRARGWPQRRADLGWIYVALAIAAASAANVRTPAFYAGLVGLAAWALWSARPRAFAAPVWMGALALAAGVGYVAHVGLHDLQKVVERVTLELFTEVPNLETDPQRSHTSIGRIGALKLTERVVLRIEPGESARPPFRLRDAVYTTYGATTWHAGVTDFAPVASADRRTWTFASTCPTGGRLLVSTPLTGGKGLLPLPLGACRVEAAPVGALARSRLGAVRVDGAPGLLSYAVAVDPRPALDGPPTETDVRLPKAEAATLTRLARELAPDSSSPAQTIALIERFFGERFRYSTYLEPRAGAGSPLADFLERSRSGHCEYFATATVLLLRAAGIPARYATGYSVHEWSGLERRWVVRARHAHAWALAWIDGVWREVDTTPPIWVAEETKLGSVWEPAADVWSWLAFQVTRWWTGGAGSLVMRYLGWLLVPLGAWALWRFVPRTRLARVRRSASAEAAATPAPGADSEFYAIEGSMAERGLGRRADEPIMRWLERIAPAAPRADDLSRLARLHDRYRFDPAGLGASDRESLRSGVAAWLAAEGSSVGAADRSPRVHTDTH